jgi:hypothetical protein
MNTPALITDPTKPERKPRISRRVSTAIDLLASGKARTQKEAAELCGMNESYLGRALKKPHVTGVLRERIERNLQRGALRASGRVVELVDSASSPVSFDASKLLLGIAGYRVAETPTSIVNVGVSVGYVIDLRPDGDTTPLPMPGDLAIDITPNP